jgi:hypothetical protein
MQLTSKFRIQVLRGFSLCLLVVACPLFFLSLSTHLGAADSVSLDQLKMGLKEREFHGEFLLNELKATDKRVESRMDNLVNALEVVADSKDSKTKVARMKKATIEGLMKVVGLYNDKRAAIQEQLVRPTSNLTLDQKQSIRKALDSRIAKRVAQMVELQQSMPTNEEYEKYKMTPGGIGWADSTIVKNEDWEQNRRVMLQSEEVRKKLVSDLQRSVERLADQDKRLKKKLQEQPITVPIMQREINRNADLLATRQIQLDQVLTEPSPTARIIGKGEAAALDEAVKIAVTGLKVEITKLFADYTALITFLPQVNSLRSQIEQATKP